MADRLFIWAILVAAAEMWSSMTQRKVQKHRIAAMDETRWLRNARQSRFGCSRGREAIAFSVTAAITVAQQNNSILRLVAGTHGRYERAVFAFRAPPLRIRNSFSR